MQIQEQEYIDEGIEQGYPLPDEEGNFGNFGQPQFANRDQGFLKWLFDFKKEAIKPLRNVWRGMELDYATETWKMPKEGDNRLIIMNEKGITWAISLIESYMSPAYIVSDFDEISYNFTMREVARVIWNNLCLRYKDFALMKSDIPRIAEEIESKIRAILLGARDNGYRDFFSTQNQNIETKNLSPMQVQKPGIFSSMAKMFKRSDQGGQYQQY